MKGELTGLDDRTAERERAVKEDCLMLGLGNGVNGNISY